MGMRKGKDVVSKLVSSLSYGDFEVESLSTVKADDGTTTKVMLTVIPVYDEEGGEGD